MAKRILFLCYHGIGHINPCFPLAQSLKQQGHEVVLAAAAFFHKYITRSGFTCYPLNSVPFGLNFERWTISQRQSRFLYWAILKARFTDQIYRERELELHHLLDSFRPDMILFDATQATDYIVLHPIIKERRIAHAMLHAMLPTHVLPGRPPANSTILPGDLTTERYALRRMRWQLNKTDISQRLLYFGMSDRFLINRLLHKNDVPFPDRPVPSLFDFEPDHVPSFILAPREFDFPDFQVPAHHHYIGFLSPHDNPPHDEMTGELRIFVTRNNASGTRIIYCSFGTVDSGNEMRVNSFLVNLAEAITDLGHALVISTGVNRTPPQIPAHENVLVLPSVPQRALLHHTDVFITHGGLSSIKEAVDAVVPMLMINVHQRFDPPGNAARVEYHGMGIRGSAGNQVGELQQQVTRLLTDETYRQRIRELKENNKRYAGRFESLVSALMDR